MQEKKIPKPEWIKDFKRRIALINLIDRSFDIDCGCEICDGLRSIAKDMGEIFKLPEVAGKT